MVAGNVAVAILLPSLRMFPGPVATGGIYTKIRSIDADATGFRRANRCPEEDWPWPGNILGTAPHAGKQTGSASANHLRGGLVPASFALASIRVIHVAGHKPVLAGTKDRALAVPPGLYLHGVFAHDPPKQADGKNHDEEEHGQDDLGHDRAHRRA